MVARYNPCGAPVEIGHRTYKTLARLYPDSDEQFEITWFVARDDVKFLRGPNAINSLQWEEDRDDLLPTVVGEVPGADRTFTYQPVKLTAIGGHVCGDRDDFAGNGTLQPNPPYVDYRPDGLPTCCGGIFEGVGGLGLSGVADVVWRGPYTGTGGLVLGGTASVAPIPTGTGGLVLSGVADVVYTPWIVGAGGLALGGTAAATYTTWTTGSGGLDLGGTADVGYTPWVVGAGGLVLGGTASVAPIPTGTGGLVLSGVADVVYTPWIVGAGGLALGGTAAATYTTWTTGSGGLDLGGTADVGYTPGGVGAGGVVIGGTATSYAGVFIVGEGGTMLGGTAAATYTTWNTGSGGLDLGGTADVGYTPPTPTPGATCATAGTMTLGASLVVPTTAGGTLLWLRFPVVLGTLYHVRASLWTNVGGITVSNAGTCPAPATSFSLAVAGCGSFTASGTGFAYIQIQPDFFSAGSVTVIADTGSC